MNGVVLAAGEGTRLRPLTEDKPKGMVEVDGTPLITHCFDELIDLGADELIVVVGYMKEAIIDHYGDAYEGVPITYTHQREQKGLAHALLTVEEHIDDDFYTPPRQQRLRSEPRGRGSSPARGARGRRVPRRGGAMGGREPVRRL